MLSKVDENSEKFSDFDALQYETSQSMKKVKTSANPTLLKSWEYKAPSNNTLTIPKGAKGKLVTNSTEYFSTSRRLPTQKSTTDN